MNKQNRRLASAGGYVLDLIRLAGGMPINLHSYMKYLAIRSLGKRTNARCLIESGTFLGVTAARCARNFERVYTIELDIDLAKQATAFLQRYRNVKVFQGDAVKLLPEVISREDVHDVVIFLDGHYSGGHTAIGDLPEPVILELGILAKFRDRVCGIVIDDFRLFGVERGFPKKSNVVLSIERLFPFPTFTLCIHADQLIVERRGFAKREQ